MTMQTSFYVDAQGRPCSMQDAVQARFTQEGARAPAGTLNPYRPGTAAAAWWQLGHDNAQRSA